MKVMEDSLLLEDSKYRKEHMDMFCSVGSISSMLGPDEHPNGSGQAGHS